MTSALERSAGRGRAAQEKLTVLVKGFYPSEDERFARSRS